MCTRKMRALSYIGAQKITFLPKPDIQTDIHTDRRTDISVCIVASLLKKVTWGWWEGGWFQDRQATYGKAPRAAHRNIINAESVSIPSQGVFLIIVENKYSYR